MKRRDPEREVLNELAVAGYTASSVSGKRSRTVSFDAYGIFDVMGANSSHVLLVQATSLANHAARLKKMMSTPALRRLLETPVTPLLISCETDIARHRRYRVEGFRLVEGRLESVLVDPMNYGLRLPVFSASESASSAQRARSRSPRSRRRST